ncbi:MAG: hypothetical protein HRT64_04815 [Erythrobacter sp.]|nr:hypothetical protein [Erythrobacter sp.]
MSRFGLFLAGLAPLCLGAPAAMAKVDEAPIALTDMATIQKRLAPVLESEASLDTARKNLVECEDGCLTPSEAVTLAYTAGEEGNRSGRFLLDVRGGGRSITGNLDRLFFINSQVDYAQFGTLTIAFEEDVLQALLRRARVCAGGQIVDGAIQVQGCRQKGISGVNMFTMMQRLNNRRIVVDGDVRLQWIDSESGLRPRKANTRGEYEPGYYQPWIWVYDADQIAFVYDD